MTDSAGSTVGDYEVVARSVADSGAGATANASAPASISAESFTGAFKGSGTCVLGSTTFTGEFCVEVRKADALSVGEYEVVVKANTTLSAPAAYDLFKFKGAIAADGTASLQQSRASAFGEAGLGAASYQAHDNFTLTLAITGGKATGSFGSSAALPGLFTFTSLAKT